MKKLVNENLILVFPEFKFLKETNQLAVCLCLISEKEFKSSNREKLKEIYLNSLSKSALAIQNYILESEPYQISELMSIFEYLITENAEGTFIKQSFNIKNWIHSFTFKELLKEEVIEDSVQFILENIQESEYIAVTKVSDFFI